MKKLVIVSDTHNQISQLKIPDGDIFIHCGDWTMLGQQPEMIKFGKFIRKLPHPIKILIPGNHDLTTDIEHLKYHEDYLKWLNLDEKTTLLINEAVVIDGFNILASSFVNPIGNPWRRWGFEMSEKKQKEFYDSIQGKVDIVITHAPPYGISDEANYGSKALLEFTERVKPRYHFFGHCHDGYTGQGGTFKDGTWHINASSCTRQYIAINPPVEIYYYD